MKDNMFRVLCVGILFVLVLGASRQQALEVVRASKFELVGPDGRVQLRIAANAAGSQLVFLDKDGTAALVLGVTADGQEISMRNKDGTPRATLVGRNDGTDLQLVHDASKSTLTLSANAEAVATTFHHKDANRLSLRANSEGGYLGIRGEKGAELARLREHKGTGDCTVRSASSEGQVSMRITQDSPRVAVFDGKAERASLGMSGGVPALLQYDTRGECRMSLVTQAEGPVHRFYDRNKVLRVGLGESEGTGRMTLYRGDMEPVLDAAGGDAGSSITLLDGAHKPAERVVLSAVRAGARIFVAGTDGKPGFVAPAPEPKPLLK